MTACSATSCPGILGPALTTSRSLDSTTMTFPAMPLPYVPFGPLPSDEIYGNSVFGKGASFTSTEVLARQEAAGGGCVAGGGRWGGGVAGGGRWGLRAAGGGAGLPVGAAWSAAGTAAGWPRTVHQSCGSQRQAHQRACTLPHVDCISWPEC